MRRLVLYLLVFAGSSIVASNIPCGKSFIPCENDILNHQQGLNGIDEGAFVSHRVPEGLLFVAAKEGERESSKLFDFRDVAFQYSGQPLSTSTSQFTRIHKADKKASDRSRSAFTSVAITKRLTALGLRERELKYGLPPNQISSTISNCPIPTINHCFATNYRSFSGICNNVAHPEWGASHTPMARIMRPDYADGVSEPRAAAASKPLPSVRSLSLTLFTPRGEVHSEVTTMMGLWMQLIASDMVNVVSFQAVNEGTSSALPCCKQGFNHSECDVIDIPAADPAYRTRLNCIPHSRSIIAPREACRLGPREQANFASSYLDASFIYGSNMEKAKQLRTFRNGQLRTAGSIGELPATDGTLQCQATHSRCALSGSDEVNILPSVAALHTVFIRHHNRLSDNLRSINRHWTDDKLYEETRKIVSAQIQHITYNEFLPVLLGRENMRNYGLNLHSAGFDSNYEMNLEGTTFNEFAVTVPYYFWALLPSEKSFVDFNNPSRLYEQGPIQIIRQLLTTNIYQPALRANDEVKSGFLKDNHEFGLDLISIALKQGRDHGIPGYTAIRASCGLGRIASFNDLREIFLPEVKFEHLSAAYSRVEDVDILVGVLAEKPLKGSLVGPTMACIIGKQMQRTRRADRFWYENYFAQSGFSEGQLSEIRNTKLAEIICANIDIRRIQRNVFFREDEFDNMAISCNSTVLSSPNFNEWRDAEGKPVFPIRQETIEKVISLAKRNLKDQERREISNLKHNQGRFQKGDPLFAYSNMMRAKEGAKQVSQISALLLETTKLLIKGEGLDTDEQLPKLDTNTLQKILPDIDVTSFVNNYTAFLSEDGQASQEECSPKMLPCDHTTRYRTFNGWCNNLKFPEYANSFAPLRHVLPPQYEDGFDAPRTRAKSGRPLPNPRRVSNLVCEDKDVSHVKFTHMVMQFGQLLDHELTHSPVARGPNDEILNCTKCDSPEKISVHCMPIRVEKDDPFFPTNYPNGEPRCLPFARSLLGQLNLGYRNQLNQLTAYVDGSAIYGSTKCEAKALRLFTRGLLNFTDFGHGQMMLPQGNQEKDCRSTLEKRSMPCFVAGDERNSHQPGLTIMHTFMVREHNRIAMQLSALNPHWNDDTVFEETRRIVVAEMQHITFAEFLPKIIGLDLLNAQNLVPKKNGYFGGYDETCDASISQPFATAAFRFGHTLIRRMFPRMNYNYKNMSEPVDLAQHFGHVGPLYEQEKGGMDAMLMGLLGTPSMAFDRHITDAVRNHLFMRRGEKTSGMDLIVLNILRARDHGVQPYNDLREFCGLRRAVKWEDLRSEMDQDNINILQSLYESVDDIDLFPGLVSERPLRGALLGTTMSCIIAEQFGRLKRCDRFYYENDNNAAKFTPAQLNEIRKVKLASIFCSNSKYMKTIQPNVFDVTDELTNAQVPCSDIPQVDLSLWKERKTCEMNGRSIALGDSVHMTPCVTCTCTLEGVACNPTKVDSCEKLTHKYLLTDIAKDTSCMIQCTDYMKRV
ncbi:hypothetical protein L5515_014280 [Caenorhabditis briggsae]|uniref:Uncharacterized protein n=1 Tax=Caenorhabditis briggsae TaxID=6238 RepID=A0AAE9J6N8_CAEBR|nr:hypothetical protein L5515_014280 [Caenorhabditis briggsae]